MKKAPKLIGQRLSDERDRSKLVGSYRGGNGPRHQQQRMCKLEVVGSHGRSESRSWGERYGR